MQNSYFVGGTNFAYISKVGNKIDAAEPRIIKQETGNSQGQMKQRIIYEIASEVKTFEIILKCLKIQYFCNKKSSRYRYHIFRIEINI